MTDAAMAQYKRILALLAAFTSCHSKLLLMVRSNSWLFQILMAEVIFRHHSFLQYQPCLMTITLT